MSKKAQLGSLLGQRSGQIVHRGAHQEILSPVNTETQKPVEATKKKKATFDMDPDLHMKLKIYAASQGKTMVEVIEQLLKDNIL